MRNSLLAIAAFGLLGCGSGDTRSRSTTTAPAVNPPVGHAAAGHACPKMQSTDTTIVAGDTTDGVAIAFTTTGDIEDLRARVRGMAERHDEMRESHHRGEGPGGGTMHPGTGGDMHVEMMHPQMLASQVTVEEIPGGARLVFVPSDPADAIALRTQAREHATMMARGECPMMGRRPAMAVQ